MNYLAHAYRHLDDPYFVAGTALPDWMNVVDRRNRARSRAALPILEDRDPRIRAFARGVMQHHHDDRWFHQTEVFVLLSTRLAVELRELLPPGGGLQAGFVGHIVVELLLDSVLNEADPGYLINYYAALESLDLDLIQHAANKICTKPFDILPRLIPRFVKERFLADYGDDARLWMRLNHVMRRVGLAPLPDPVVAWLAGVRPRVTSQADALLTEPVPLGGEQPAPASSY